MKRTSGIKTPDFILLTRLQRVAMGIQFFFQAALLSRCTAKNDSSRVIATSKGKRDDNDGLAIKA
jgi:hypothetical protein